MPKNDITLEIDTALVRKKLTEFLRTEIIAAGFKHAVLGVSGGVDSSLACFLTAEALGPENVLAARMPYKTSAPDSLEHSELVIQITGVNETTIPISEPVDALFAQFPDADNIRRGNAMARMRMIVLYDLSVSFNGLVVGTGNKTEYLLGYTTLYGDSACALNPLGDLYKTQVRQLARAVGVPEVIIAKPPSADLWVGQTDEDELGFTYDELDRLLLLLIDRGIPPQACIETGFNPDFVKAVISRIKRTQFKRILPPIANLSDHTVGYDSLSFPDL
jgi:NAD+ synthase